MDLYRKEYKEKRKKGSERENEGGTKDESFKEVIYNAWRTAALIQKNYQKKSHKVQLSIHIIAKAISSTCTKRFFGEKMASL